MDNESNPIADSTDDAPATDVMGDAENNEAQTEVPAEVNAPVIKAVEVDSAVLEQQAVEQIRKSRDQIT